MDQIISKEELDEIMKIDGEVRGDGIKSYTEFILIKEGEEGLKRLKEELVTLDFPIKLGEIKRMSFYPINFWVVLVLSIKRLFNYDDKKFQEMGGFQVKSSLIIRVFMKYFFSIDRAAKELSKIWKQFFAIGEINIIELNKEKRFLSLKLSNFNVHPISCQIILGVLMKAVEIILKGNISGEETRCVHRGDQHHEFLIKW